MLSEEIAGKMIAASILADKGLLNCGPAAWSRITALVSWERLMEYHAAAVKGTLSQGSIRDIARLVHMRSYADLIVASTEQLEETTHHLQVVRSVNIYKTPNTLLFDTRLAQVFMLLSQHGRADTLLKAIKKKMTFFNSPIDLAVVLLLQGTQAHDNQQYHNAVELLTASLQLLTPLRRGYGLTVRPFYLLANLWLAHTHRQLGNKWRMAPYAYRAGRLRWSGGWTVDWGNDLTQPIPYIEPVTDS